MTATTDSAARNAALLQSEIESEDLLVHDTTLMDEKILISPAQGRFRFSPSQNFTSEGEYVLEGQLIGHVVSKSGDEIPVTASHSGWVMQFFLRDGWPVQSRQPVLSLRLL
ncbi:MAG: hypothetical protein KY429_08045 [Actinobacteria bacterium]|nr:hypothetical protein [Actinomycetota bacterium]